MLKPEGVKVLVIPEEVKEKTDGGIYLAPEARDREQYAMTKGKVVAIGPDVEACFEDRNLEIGDVVIFAKYGGAVVKDDDIEYRVINDEDIMAKVVNDADAEI